MNVEVLQMMMMILIIIIITEFLIFLYWFAHGVSYKVTAHVFDVLKSTVHLIKLKIAADIRENKHILSFSQTSIPLLKLVSAFQDWHKTMHLAKLWEP